MLKRIIELKKYENIINYKLFEVNISIILSFLFVGLLYFLNIYEDFFSYQDALTSFILEIIFSYIGLIGIILSGVAIIVSVINNKLRKKIEEINKIDVIEALMYDFVWLALVIAFQIFNYTLIYFLIFSNKDILPQLFFYILLIICVYLFFYTIFSTVATIVECIGIFNIANIYEDINNKESSTLELANELRIDFILNRILEEKGEKVFLDKLIEFVMASDYEQPIKEKLIKYFTNYYQH